MIHTYSDAQSTFYQSAMDVLAEIRDQLGTYEAYREWYAANIAGRNLNYEAMFDIGMHYLVDEED